jgi:hypothetical protein
MYTYPIPNDFRDRAVSLHNPKLLIRNRYYFLIPIYIVQVTILVHITTFSKIPPRLYSEITLSRKMFGICYMNLYISLTTMTYTMASHNIDISSWGTVDVI